MAFGHRWFGRFGQRLVAWKPPYTGQQKGDHVSRAARYTVRCRIHATEIHNRYRVVFKRGRHGLRRVRSTKVAPLYDMWPLRLDLF